MRHIIKSTIQRMVLVLFGVVVAGVLAEIVIRVFVREQYDYPRGLYVADDLRGYWLASNFCGPHRQINGDFSVEYCTDENGFRKTHRPAAISFPVVVVLGDSFSFGVGVNDEETYASEVARRIRATVINGSISGYDVPSAVQSLKAIEAEGVSPGIIVLGVYLGNDLLPPGRAPAFAVNTSFDGSVVSRGSLWGNRLSFERRLRYNVRLYGFIASRLTRSLPMTWLHTFRSDPLESLGILPENSQPIEDRFFEDLMAFKHTTVERFPGVRIILLLIPTKYQVEAAYREEVCEGFHICEAGDIHRSINLVRGAATRLDLEILDMQPILSNAGEKKDWFYYRHNDHWTKDAHELAGIELSRMIERGE